MSPRRMAIISTVAVAVGGLVVLGVLGVDIAGLPSRFRDAATAVAEVIIAVFLVGFLVLLGSWVLRTERGITVLPFDRAADAEEARRLARDLAAELEHVRAAHCASTPEILDIRLTGQPKAAGKGSEGLTLPTFAPTQEPFDQVIADVGAVELVSVKLHLGNLLVALRRMAPGRDRLVYLLPSVERSKSHIRLRARLQGQAGGLASSWMTVTPLTEGGSDGRAPEDEAIKDLAYEIAGDLAPSIGVRTGPALRSFTEALERLRAYSVTRDERTLAEVRTAWENAYEREPKCPSLGRLAYTMGIAYLNHGNGDEAERIFGTATTANAGDPRPWLGLGIARADLGKDVLARRAYKTALVLDPKSPHARNNLAELFRATGRLEEGIKECERALQIDRRFAYARFTLGNLYSARADRFSRVGRRKEAAIDYERALKEYRRALETDRSKSKTEEKPLAAYPAYAYACNATANVLAKQGEFPEAVDHHREAIALDSNDWFFWHSLGNTRRLQGHAERDPKRRAERYEAALDALEHARPGGFAWTLYHLGEVALANGDREAAEAAFDEAIAMHSNRSRVSGRATNRRLEPTGRAPEDRDAKVDCAFDEVVHGCDRAGCHVYLAYAYKFTGRSAEASIVLRGALAELTEETAPGDATGGDDWRARFSNPGGDPVLWHVLNGVTAWCCGDGARAATHMRRAIGARGDVRSTPARGRPRRTPPAINPVEPVVIEALARLVLGEKARALELVRNEVADEAPRPFQASTLWLSLLLHEGAPIDGLDEIQRLLGHPAIYQSSAAPQAVAVSKSAIQAAGLTAREPVDRP